jgi:hypothetical protein
MRFNSRYRDRKMNISMRRRGDDWRRTTLVPTSTDDASTENTSHDTAVALLLLTTVTDQIPCLGFALELRDYQCVSSLG